jgi:glycosyltransferase involved in cell wall biosynthesis
MKVLVFAHRLEIGGTQTNAIELAAALRDLHDFDVVVFATPGPMLHLVEEKGLRFLPAPDAFRHPSPARMRAVRRVVRQERPDLIHAWDWWQCLEAYYSVHLPLGVPLIVTDMMMELTRILPRTLPTTFGTPRLVDEARAAGRRRAHLMLPLVDVGRNAPGVVDSEPLRRRCAIEEDGITVVTVSRLSMFLKSESLFRTVDVIRMLGHDMPVRFVIVGDGEAREQLQRKADETNAELGRRAVILAGPLQDPRPAYAMADIVVGMGGSALRAMAFAKPVVVVGERGFSAPFSPTTAPFFYREGFYGRGDGDSKNMKLTSSLRDLCGDPVSRGQLGDFSRRFVVEHFSVETIAGQFAGVCRDEVGRRPRLGAQAVDVLRTTAVYVRERGFWIPSRDRSAGTRSEEEPAVPGRTPLSSGRKGD